MPINRDDPRVRKTRRGLQEALVRLILRQGYDSISIQDIATEAETARITFYRHYRDKEELLTDCLNVLYEELKERTEQLSPEALLAGRSPTFALYEHIEEKEPLYRILFSSQGTHTVIERMRHHIALQVMETVHRTGRQPVGDIPLDVVAHHAASAQLGLAVWWLDHGKPYPAAYMAQISVWLSLYGMIHTVGGAELQLPAPELKR